MAMLFGYLMNSLLKLASPIAIKLQMPFRLENRDHLRQASEWATLATYLPEGVYTITLFLTVCQSGIL